MKSQFFSTFVHGLERPVEAMLRKEGGVAVERVMAGAAIYRSVREPSMPFFHQTFRLLYQMKPVQDVNEALRRLLSSGSWLDRFPYEETAGKRFRVVTAAGGQLVAANMRQVNALEKAICEHTDMRSGRERPDIELWVLLRPEAAYFLWRIGKRTASRQEGQPRTDVSAVVAFLASAGGGSIAVMGACGASVPLALRAAGAKTVTCICPDHQVCETLAQRVRSVCVVEGSGGHTGLADASQNGVVIHIPPKAERTPGLEDDLRNMLFEARRILCEDGRLIVIAPLAHAQDTLRKAQGVRVSVRYDVVLGGQPCAIWGMALQSEEMEEA